jgi:hypothetical protein
MSILLHKNKNGEWYNRGIKLYRLTQLEIKIATASARLHLGFLFKDAEVVIYSLRSDAILMVEHVSLALPAIISYNSTENLSFPGPLS